MMRDASDQLAAAVSGSHRVASQVQSWRGGEQLTDVVPFEGGSVTGSDSAVPGGFTLTVPMRHRGESWDPTGDPFHPIAPYGQQLLVSRGVAYAGGTTELLDLGWYLITDAEPDVGSGKVTVTAAPLEQLLADDAIPVAQAPKAGGTFVSELRRLCGDMVPVGAPDSGLLDRRVPAATLWENDVLSAVQQIATAWPARVWVDSQGMLRCSPIIDAADARPVTKLVAGERGVIASWGTSASRDRLVNGYYVTGEQADGAGASVYGSAFDMSPTSPTFWDGPFGHHAASYSSPLLATNAQCAKAATTMLAKAKRDRDPVTVELIPDPRLELGDWVELDTPTVSGLGVITALDLPLTADGGTMSITLGMVS